MIKKNIGLIVLFLLACIAAMAQSMPPRIFFTDLQSGPNTGGENGNGVFVTIYGANFGSTRGTSTVTVGGGAVAAYPIWGASHLWYQKIVVQLGANAKTGNIVVTTSAGSSNGVSFTVRSGRIFFAATNGSDSNAGSATAPFGSIIKCKNALTAGDTCYVKDGLNFTGTENYSSSIVVGPAGTASAPIALLTYPGAKSTIGNTSNLRGIDICGGLSSCTNGVNWVIGGFTLTAEQMAIDVQVDNARIVGNTLSCPSAPSGAADGCLQVELSSYATILGNEVKNVYGGGKLFHGVYLGADGHDFELGWNSVHDVTNGACRGIQIYSGTTDSYNITVHDNTIYNIGCDGLNLATVNPDKGYVKAYNNVIHQAGNGPDPGGGPNMACINIASNSSPSTPVDIYDNTLYDCGKLLTSASGMISPAIRTRLRNNVIYAVNGERYITSGTASLAGSTLSGSNNIWYGGGTAPSQTTGNISSNPLLVNAAGNDFHLQSGSPAINAGVTTDATQDIAGIVRSSPDIGAYEYGTTSGGVTQTSPCDLNRDGTTNQTDVQLGINEAIGAAACTNGDLDGNGRCDAVDVQRIVNAANSGTCRVGP